MLKAARHRSQRPETRADGDAPRSRIGTADIRTATLPKAIRSVKVGICRDPCQDSSGTTKQTILTCL